MKKILLINSSSHQNGCTWRALKEVQDQLTKNGVESDLIWLGNAPVADCIACGYCGKKGECVFKDEVNEGGITNKLLKDIEIYEMENGPEKAAEKVIIDLEAEKLKQKQKQQQAVANNINNITGQDKEYSDYFMKVGNNDEHIKKIEDELNKLELPFKSK